MNERRIQEKLQKEIEESRSRMSNCKHEFLDPIYDSDTVLQPYGSVQDGAGSDPHWSPAGYKKVKIDRWSRECKLCGHKEFIHKQEIVRSDYAPKF